MIQEYFNLALFLYIAMMNIFVFSRNYMLPLCKVVYQTERTSNILELVPRGYVSTSKKDGGKGGKKCYYWKKKFSLLALA